MNWTPITQSWTAQDYDDALTYVMQSWGKGHASEADCALRYTELLAAKLAAGVKSPWITVKEKSTIVTACMAKIESGKLLAFSYTEIAPIVHSGVTASLEAVLTIAMGLKRVKIEQDLASLLTSGEKDLFKQTLDQKIQNKIKWHLVGPPAKKNLEAFHAALGLIPPVSQPVAVPPATTQKWLDIASLNVRVPTHAGVPSVLRGQKVYKVSRQVYAASQAYAKAAETQAHEQGVVYLKRASEHNFYVTAFETCQEVGQLFKNQALTFYYHGGSVAAEDLPATA